MSLSHTIEAWLSKVAPTISTGPIFPCLSASESFDHDEKLQHSRKRQLDALNVESITKSSKRARKSIKPRQLRKRVRAPLQPIEGNIMAFQQNEASTRQQK